MKKNKLFMLLLTCFFASTLSATIHTVNAGEYYYTPSTLTINQGDTVKWINDGGFHDVNADVNSQTSMSFNNPVSFQSAPTSSVGAVIYTYIFNVPGVYNYDCSIGSHAASGMVASVTVNAASNSIYDIVSNSTDHTTLKTAIDACALDGTLSGAGQLGQLTLFAPTDAAFNLLPSGTVAALLNDIPQLTDILLHHVVQGSVMSSMLSNNQVVTTLNGTDVTVTINTSGVFIDNAQVTVADVIADNGVVHVIDAVLLPPNPSNTIYDIVSNSTDHTTLNTAIIACGLGGYLSASGPFTLFAPTDAAFNLLPAGTVAALLNDIPQLTDILKHHVVSDSVMSTMLSNNQVVTTLLGTDVTVTINANGIFIDNAQVTVSDIVADNGVVHVIDAVLLPPTQTNSIYDIVSNSTDHTTLKAAVDACALDVVLSDPGSLTLFAPTDAAFNALPAGMLAALLNDIPLLTDILKHHVVNASVVSGALVNGQVVTTLFGADVTVTINSMGVFIDNAQVTIADIVADNGVVHVIDAVLVPSTITLPIPNTIYDIVSNSADHSTLKTAIDACALDVVLSDPGTLTLFAPTDAAFNLLPAGTVAALLNDIPQLTDILKHHVVGASVMSGVLSNNQLVTTLNGDVTVTINANGVFIDNAQVIVADIVADNGVVHVIDAVLLPTTTSVSELYSLDKEYLYSINILGEKIDRLVKNQIIFDVYRNGEVVKRFIR